MRLASTVSIFLLALFLAVMASVRQSELRSWDAAVTGVQGEDLATFRLKAGDERYLISWTQSDFEALQRGDVPGAIDVLWVGASQRTQVEGQQYAIPHTVVSADYPRRFRKLLADPPSDVPRGVEAVILSETMARELYGDAPLDEVLGRRLSLGSSHAVVANVYEGSGQALLLRELPPERTDAGELVLDQVLVVAASASQLDDLVESLSAFLASRPHLASLEAVSYRTFIAPNVPLERQTYARELRSLFEGLVIATIVMTVLNLVQAGHLWAGRHLKRWSLLRTLGADRRRLLARELPALLVPLLVAGWSGAVVGAVLARWQPEGEFSWVALALTLIIITICVVLGAVPIAMRALRSFPWRVLHDVGRRRGRDILPLGSLVALVGTMALVVIAGGLTASGRRAVQLDIDQIGRTMVQFRSDFNSIYPSLGFDAQDLTALRAAAPQASFVLLTQESAQIDGLSVPVSVAVGDYLSVAGLPVDVGIVEGVIIGQSLAEAHPVGSTLTMHRALRAEPEKWPVVAHAPPEPDYLESIRPRDDQLVVLLPDTAGLLRAPPLSRIYGTFGAALGDQESEAALDALNARRTGRARVVMSAAAQSLLGRLAILQRQAELLLIALPFVLATAAIGAVTLTVDWAVSRLYATALRRVFGAKLREVFRGSLRQVLRAVVVLSASGTLVGTIVLYVWAPRIGDTVQFPFVWWSAAAIVAFVLGGLAAMASASWINRHSPMSVLRTARE